MTWQVEQLIHDRYQLLALKRDRPGHQVWLALDQTTQTKVILKTLGFAGEIQWDEVKLFEREIEVLRRLQHPRTPCLVDAFTQERPYFLKCLVESYIHAPSLQAFLDRQQMIPEQQIWAIAAQVLSILQDFHALTPAILHRDLKPSNILIDAQKHVYLIDLGAVGIEASAPSSSLDAPTIVGSYGYTPVEQFMGQAVPASDLYGLGATLMQLLTGLHPNELMNDQLRLGLPSSEIPAPLKQWLYAMTAPQACDRMATAQQAIRALEQAHSQTERLSKSQRSSDPSLSRVTITSEADLLRLTVAPIWNSSTIATTDISMIIALGLIPPLLGLWWAIALFANMRGLGLVGTDLLILALSLLPTLIVAPKLFWNVLSQSIICTPSAMQIQWKVGKLQVFRRQIAPTPLSTFSIVSDASQTWSIYTVANHQSQPIVLRIPGIDIDPTYGALEQQLLSSSTHNLRSQRVS